jgi:hypothetical protein
MFTQYKESYSTRYDQPFTAWLDEITDHGTYVDEVGDANTVGLLLHVGGRHVLHYGPMGFVTSYKMGKNQDFRLWCSQNFPDIYDYDMDFWSERED